MARYASNYLENLPKMYNEELKKRYIKEKESESILPSNYLLCQFSKLSEYENVIGKDCSNFSKLQIEEYLKLLSSTSFEGLQCLVSQLSLYTQFCLEQNLVFDCQNHYLEFQPSDIKGCINKALLQMKFVTRETIYKWCDELPNPRDAYYLLGSFEGLKGKNFKDLWSLRPENINGNIATLWDSREIELSNKLVGIIQDCIEEDTYYSISGTGSKKMKLIDMGFVAKSYPNVKDFNEISDFQRSRQVFNAISRIFDYFGVIDTMSANSIYESGKLEMIKELAKEHNMTCKQLIYSPYIKEVEKKYNCNIVKSIYCTKYEDYLE